jgi:glycosyltransferase involved in cell wall biosynthesis
MSISVILTVHNEGEELKRTIASIKANTHNLTEIIIIDDSSSDGCCEGIEDQNIKIIRHDHRIGVAYSRNEGAEIAKGDVFSFLDGHQRLTKNCLDITSKLAIKKNAIVSPGIRGFHKNNQLIHGAKFHLCPDNGFFSADWITQFPWKRVRQLSALRAPGYSIPKILYHKLRWIKGMKGWGGSEALLSVKAFFTKIPIFYTRGPVAYHMFKKQFNYEVNWGDIWLNHALIARICFDNDSWDSYWLPELFQNNLSESCIEYLNSDEILDQHHEFKNYKLRSDRDFWKILLKQKYPDLLEISVESSNQSKMIYEQQ